MLDIYETPKAITSEIEPTAAEDCGFNCNWGFGIGIVIVALPAPGPS